MSHENFGGVLGEIIVLYGRHFVICAHAHQFTCLDLWRGIKWRKTTREIAGYSQKNSYQILHPEPMVLTLLRNSVTDNKQRILFKIWAVDSTCKFLNLIHYNTS